MTPVHITGGHTFHHISPGQILTSIEQGGMDRTLTIKYSQVEQIDTLLQNTSVSITFLLISHKLFTLYFWHGLHILLR